MLELLRKAGQTWIAKALLVLLVGSFGIWGVQSSMFAGASDAVVTVGDQKVSNVEFQINFNNAMGNMSQRFGTRLTLEQAKMFGVENLVLSQLVSGATLDQLAENMKLGLSEERLLQLIQDEPAFKDSTGAFSRTLMEQRLQNARIRPQDFVIAKSKEAVRSQVADALVGGFKPSATLLDALKSYATETRSIDYILLGKANIDPVAAPDDKTLTDWFAGQKQNYKAPEYRKITYVKLEPADIADVSAVSDAAVAEDYEKHKNNYRTPETRTVEQLAFTNQADADAAVAKLAAGTTFDQLVTEQGKTATDVLLGDFTKDKLPNPAMGEAVFSVKADGGVTPVVTGLLGPVILRVTNIRPEVTKPLDEVKDSIRKELALVLANDEIQNVYDRFEDSRASGVSLVDVAKQLQLKAVILDAVDAQGKDMKEAEIKDIPSADKLLAEAFQTEPGVEPLPLTIENGGYLWFEVDGVTPARERTLDEVKAKAVADWTAEQERNALAKKAEEIVKQVRDGATMADVAAKLSLAVENKSGIRRGMTDAVLSPSAISATFGGANGHVASAAGADGDGQIVLKVTDVQEGTLDDPNSDQQMTALANAAGDDVLDQMVNQLQTEYGVRLNRTLANQLMVQQ